jgi:hypothetical protein
MNEKQKNTLLVFGILAGLLSLPMTWVTIHNPQIDAMNSDVFGSMFQGVSLPVTGINGSAECFGLSMPLWFVASIAIIAGAMQLMRHTQMFAIPRFAEWAVAVIGIAWMIPLTCPLFSGRASLGIGWVLGVFCALMPLMCLIVPTRSTKQSEL